MKIYKIRRHIAYKIYLSLSLAFLAGLSFSYMALRAQSSAALSMDLSGIREGQMLYADISKEDNFNAQMFNAAGVDVHDHGGTQKPSAEWRTFVKNVQGQEVDAFCVQHGTMFLKGENRVVRNALELISQENINKIVAGIDYINKKDLTKQDKYFAMQAWIWTVQDGKENFGYSLSDGVKKNFSAELKRVVLERQSDFYYGDYHGRGLYFDGPKQQDTASFDWQKEQEKNPRLYTKASDANDGDKLVLAQEQAQIVDKVKYCGLMGTKEYALSGVLMDRASGQSLKIDGEEVRASAKVKPKNQSCAEVSLVFNFDASALKNKKIVVFEELQKNGSKIAEHKDLFDDGQTVEIIDKPRREFIYTREVKSYEIIPKAPKAGVRRVL